MAIATQTTEKSNLHYEKDESITKSLNLSPT